MTLKEKAVFIACPDASMTWLSFTRDSAKAISRLKQYSPLEVVLICEIECSRGAVAGAQRLLNGDRAHSNWFDGVVDEARAQELIEEGSKEHERPGTQEWVSWRFQVREWVAEVGDVRVPDEIARKSFTSASNAIGEMEHRVVAEAHVAQVAQLSQGLNDAVASRIASKSSTEPETVRNPAV